MPPRNARGRAKSLTGARGARRARRNLNEGDDHQESVMGGRASAPVENVGNVRVPIRATENRATTAMKAFLQLRPPTFKGEPDPLVAEDWLEQITKALDTILVIEKELRVLFARGCPSMVEDRGGRSMNVAQYEAKFTSLSRFAKAFVSTEEEKAKQFMQGLRPSIRNKIAGNLIKVYSTMVSSVAAIEETLNETRKIQNPKSQREGTSNQSEGRSFKKPKSFYYTALVSYEAQGQSLVRGPPTCFQCDQVGHISRQCTQKENNQGATGSQPTRSIQASRVNPSFTSTQLSYQSRPQAITQKGQRTQGRVYAMTSAAEPSGTVRQQEQQLNTSVVRGTLLMFNSRARVLIDRGASHSFITSSFALALGLKVEILDSVLMLDTPMEGRTTLRLCSTSGYLLYT
ncbi:hypothetical protein Acr_29g0003240 [Actinidia rufa]|uniref:CCHC-type domain-containing protein n=1 Tax=Actinidia rufa TaxID=165716 RepID=A0A7J0HDT0_9ERIC|nr:hypothetical protein Acr_29g0003240 [Actinidia rufa]